MDAHGNVLEIEEEVAFASVPAGVQAGLTKAAVTGKIVKIESLTSRASWSLMRPTSSPATSAARFRSVLRARSPRILNEC
jgi:hypothetical protein